MAKPDLTPPRAGRLRRALPTWLHVSDIQGLAQLTTQGVLGVAELAESVHGNVYKAVAATLPGGSRFIDRTPGSTGVKPLGITGLVYGGVRGITRLAGSTVNAVLARAAPLLPRAASSPAREAMLSALNGVLGDRLQDTANPLAISMSLRSGGETLTLDGVELAARLPQATGKILVMVHGLCMSDLQWGSRSSDDKPVQAVGYAELLARDLGFTPVYLHYNSGLHISTNGEELNRLLERLGQAWPVPVTEVTLLTHSMGGLVARSACHHAEAAGRAWRKRLKNLVFLGTPHRGAPLEMLGNWVDRALGSNIVTQPFARIGQIRSAGITDLRFANLQDMDWQDMGGQDIDRFEAVQDAVPQPLPLPTGVACFAVAAVTLPEPPSGVASLQAQLAHHLVGDGLVPLPSALGAASGTQADLMIPRQHQWISWSTGHIALMHSPGVARQLHHWLADTGSPAQGAARLK
jgi:pimeloyl-ACP methyl ester carboxylesterase